MRAIEQSNWHFKSANINKFEPGLTTSSQPYRNTEGQMTHIQDNLSGRLVGFRLTSNGRASWKAPIGSPESQSVAMQFLVVAAVLLVAITSLMVPTFLVLPTVSIAALALAGVGSLMAYLSETATRKAGIRLWDAAGILALIGFGAAALSEPQVVFQILENGR
jgi:hypothetical protein